MSILIPLYFWFWIAVDVIWIGWLLTHSQRVKKGDL